MPYGHHRAGRQVLGPGQSRNRRHHDRRVPVPQIHDDLRTALRAAPSRCSARTAARPSWAPKAMVVVTRSGCWLVPNNRLQGRAGRVHGERPKGAGAATAPEQPKVSDHWKNFLDCIKTRQKPTSDIENLVRSSAVCILGNVSMRAKTRLDFDEKTFTVRQPEARPFTQINTGSPGSWRSDRPGIPVNRGQSPFFIGRIRHLRQSASWIKVTVPNFPKFSFRQSKSTAITSWSSDGGGGELPGNRRTGGLEERGRRPGTEPSKVSSLPAAGHGPAAPRPG